MLRLSSLLVVILAYAAQAVVALDAGVTGELEALLAHGVTASSNEKLGLMPSVRVRVSARSHAVLSSQTSGRIVKVAVRDGERFREGDVLVRLDDSLIRLQAARSRAAYRRQETIHGMIKELAELGTKGEAEVEVADMDLEQARAEMESMALVLSRTTVTAPFSGRVADVFAKESQYVAEGQPLLEILDDSTLELEFIVSSHWLRWFRPGHRFEVTVEETGKTYQAVLQRLGGKVDPLSQSVKAYADLVEPAPELMEGMSGAAAITSPADRAGK